MTSKSESTWHILCGLVPEILIVGRDGLRVLDTDVVCDGYNIRFELADLFEFEDIL